MLFFRLFCKVFLFFLLISNNCLAQASQALPDFGTEATVPFVYNSVTTRGIVIQVRIGNSSPLPFLLDTGTNTPLLLEDWAAQKLGLKPTNSTFNLPQSDITFKRVEDQDIFLLGSASKAVTDTATEIHVPNVPILVGSLGLQNRGSHLAGVIGLPIIENCTVRIDFTSQLLSLDTKPHSPLALTNAVLLSMEKDTDTSLYHVSLPYYAHRAALASKENFIIENSPMLLDTGATFTRLPAYPINKLNPCAAFLRSVTNISKNGFEVIWLLPNLRPYGLNLENVTVGMGSQLIEPTIGMDVLSRFLVILDFPNKEVWLQPEVSRIKTLQRGTVGVLLTHKQNGFFVIYVQAKSPSERAGISTGDKVLAVNGQSMDSLTTVLAEDLINDQAGNTVLLNLLTKKGVFRLVKIISVSETAPQLFLPSGFRPGPQKLHSGYGIVVDAILCASKAYKSGLRAGDLILAINGQPTQASTALLASALITKFNPLLFNTSANLLLQVRHLGEAKPQTIALPIDKPMPTVPSAKP